MTPIFILIAKLVWTRQVPPWRVTAAVLMIVGGCVIAGAGDLGFDLMGCLYSVGSCIAQATFLVLVELQVRGICWTLSGAECQMCLVEPP